MKRIGYDLKYEIPDGAKVLCARILLFVRTGDDKQAKTFLLKRGYSNEEWERFLLDIDSAGEHSFVEDESVVWFEDGSWLERVDTGGYYIIWHHTSTPEIPEGL